MKLGTAEADYDGTVYLEYSGSESFECIDEIVLSDQYRNIEYDIIEFNNRVVINFPFGHVRLKDYEVSGSTIVKKASLSFN